MVKASTQVHIDLQTAEVDATEVSSKDGGLRSVCRAPVWSKKIRNSFDVVDLMSLVRRSEFRFFRSEPDYKALLVAQYFA